MRRRKVSESIPALVLRPGLAEQLRRLAPGREFQGAHSVSVANVGVGAVVPQGYHAIPVPALQRCRQRRAAAGIPGIPIRTPVDRHLGDRKGVLELLRRNGGGAGGAACLLLPPAAGDSFRPSWLAYNIQSKP